jgi:hypothetical protein
MEINYVYQRLRKDFGRSAKQFTDSATTALNETTSDADKVCELLLRYLSTAHVPLLHPLF